MFSLLSRKSEAPVFADEISDGANVLIYNEKLRVEAGSESWRFITPELRNPDRLTALGHSIGALTKLMPALETVYGIQRYGNVLAYTVPTLPGLQKVLDERLDGPEFAPVRLRSYKGADLSLDVYDTALSRGEHPVATQPSMYMHDMQYHPVGAKAQMASSLDVFRELVNGAKSDGDTQLRELLAETYDFITPQISDLHFEYGSTFHLLSSAVRKADGLRSDRPDMYENIVSTLGSAGLHVTERQGVKSVAEELERTEAHRQLVISRLS